MRSWILAWRSLAHHRGFASAAIIILGLGIGANTAMFSMVDAVLLKPLPYPHGDRLVAVYEASPAKKEKESLVAPARLADWERMNRTFVALSGSYSDNVTDTSGSEPERLAASRVMPRYFAVYQATPQLGRTFTPQEEQFGGPQAAVISYGLWTRRYRQDSSAVGRRLILGGKGYTIVGVLPADFTSAKTDVWLPAQTPPPLMQYRDARFLGGVGRMKPGVTAAQAQQDLARVQQELAREYPKTDKGWSAEVTDLKEFRVGDYRRSLSFAFGAVGLLLLIAVANIAGLMLSQLERRARELAIRSSLGATRWQVAGAVMREAVLIAAAGLALGCAAAAWLVEYLGRTFRTLPHSHAFQLDWRALLFAAMTGAAAALLCGLLPALQATRADVATLLAQVGRGGSGSRGRWQPALVCCQIALSTLLLASAGLMLRSYYNLTRVDAGFDAGHALTFHVSAAWNEDRNRVGEMQEQLLAKLRGAPGVEAAGFVNFLPTQGASLRYQVGFEGLEGATDSGRITVGERSISHGYLKAMGAPLIAGEDCPELGAINDKTPEALVSQRFAEMYGNGRSLVGRHLHWFDMGNSPAMQIIGVVGEMKEDTLNVTPAPYLYVCFAPGGWPDPEYVVRTAGNPRTLEAAIRPLVRSVAPSRAVFGVKTLGELLDEGLQQPRLNTRMLATFALAAILLASVGLYSLLSLVVTSRTREIGVRMTLGAEPRKILVEVVGAVARLVLAGVAAGVVLALIVDRLLRSLLYGVGPADTATLAVTVLILALVAAIAAFGPARRAAKIDPIAALRIE